jgi:hypothetical protein
MASGAPARAALVPELGLRWWARVAVLFVVAGTPLFSPVLVSWFASDDFMLYAKIIQGGIPFLPDEASGGFLRPLVGLSLWLIYYIAGLEPFPPHAFSVLLHLANSLLVVKLGLVLQHGRSHRNTFDPIAAGVIFLVLGCHGEAVAWISSLGDLLATFFVILMLVECCRALQTGAGAHWIGSMACMGLALFSKESAFAAPLLLMLLLLFHWGGGTERTFTRRDLVALLAHVALLIIYLLYRRWMLGAFVGGYGAHGHLRFYPDLVAQSLGRFLWRVFLPPIPEWLLAPIPNMEGFWAWGFLAVIFVPVLVIAWRRRRDMGLGLLCALAFLAALAPVFNVRIYLSDMEGERYLYLPSLFAALGAGYAIALLPRMKWRIAALSVFALFQASVLLAGVLHWQGASTIARNIVASIQEQHRGGTIVLVNKPDAYKGALVFRTGLPEALRYFGPQTIESPDVTALFAAGLHQWDHSFTVESAPAPGTYILAAGDRTSGLSEEDRRDLIEVVEMEPGRAEFQFRNALHDVQIFYYDAPGVTMLTFASP